MRVVRLSAKGPIVPSIGPPKINPQQGHLRDAAEQRRQEPDAIVCVHEKAALE